MELVNPDRRLWAIRNEGLWDQMDSARGRWHRDIRRLGVDHAKTKASRAAYEETKMLHQLHQVNKPPLLRRSRK